MMFILTGVIIDSIFHGNIQMTNYAFSKMAIATVVIGFGFGAPAVVYILRGYLFLHRQSSIWVLVVLL